MIQRFKNWNKEEPDEPAREIRDKQLESMRRERQFQLMQEEKKQLKKDIAAYKMQHIREHMFGVKEEMKERKLLDNMKEANIKLLKNKKIKHQNMLKQKSIFGKKSLLNNRVNEFKKKKL